MSDDMIMITGLENKFPPGFRFLSRGLQIQLTIFTPCVSDGCNSFGNVCECVCVLLSQANGQTHTVYLGQGPNKVLWYAIPKNPVKYEASAIIIRCWGYDVGCFQSVFIFLFKYPLLAMDDMLSENWVWISCSLYQLYPSVLPMPILGCYSIYPAWKTTPN